MISLSDTLIGYAPIVDRKRNAIATRASVLVPGSREATIGRLYEQVAAASPADAPAVLLAVDDLQLADDILQVDPVENLWIEVPAPFLVEPGGEALAVEMHRRGFRMVLAGRPVGELTPALLPAFRMTMIHVDTDRRLKDPSSQHDPQAARRTIPYAQLGVGSIALMERCFATGAVAVVGWPFEDTFRHSKSVASNPDFSTVARLLQLVDKGADVADMEALIRRDPSLAYRLLRYINSAAFGLTVQVHSFRHAVMMLGYAKLKRWLTLLLATSCKESNLRPVMFASFRRGLFLEHLIAQDQDESVRDELFILGVFSFLDKLFSEPLETLLGQLSVPESVTDALVARSGPYAPYVRIAELVEQGPSLRLPDELLGALLSTEQCNRAVMQALLTPDLLAA
ncbi:MAG: HDOD domain-containing protein [Burkholderiaceae bacterium]